MVVSVEFIERNFILQITSYYQIRKQQIVTIECNYMNRGSEVIKIIDISEEEIAFDSHNQATNKQKNKKKLPRSTIIVLVIILIASLAGYAYLDYNRTDQAETHGQKSQTHPQNAIAMQHSNSLQTYVDTISNQETINSRKQIQLNELTNKEIAQEQFGTNTTNQQVTQSNEITQQQGTAQQESTQYRSFPNRAISSYAIKRKNSYQQILAAFKKQNQQELKKHLLFYNITISQLLRAIVLAQYTPLDTLSSTLPAEKIKLEQLDQEERIYYEKKYNISSYKQLPMCIVVPTYNNYKRFRYYFNLHSILQQHYSNYRIVIIDDASSDDTAKSIEQEIKNNSYIRQKVVLVKNSKRQYHMANFYKGIHQHCKKGQILVTVDGDDQLVGRYVLKVINAQYHRSKAMSIYSNHIQSKRQVVFDIGISNSYPQQVKQNNTYREKAHLYSHLRTTWVDLFLLIKEDDMKDSAGNWFKTAVDNAMFYPIFEMSCGQVEYLSEIFYKYNTFTGQNVDNLPYWMRKKANDDIISKQRYKCLKQWDRQTYDTIKAYIT